MIKILILEDTKEKLSEIMSVVLKNEDIKDSDITYVDCTRKARDELKDYTFDLFITDLLVPETIINEPNPKEAETLLFDLINDDIMNKPTHIIGLTAYEDEIEEYKHIFTDDNWELLPYSENEDDWEKKVTNKVKYIVDAKKNNQVKADYIFDIAIICALKDPEFRQVKNLSNNWEKVNIPNSSLSFFKTTFNRGNKSLSVVAVSNDLMGMVNTAILATQVIEFFKPKYLAMTGIAAGNPDEVDLGDVILFEHAWDYNSGKIKSDENKNQVFELDLRQEPVCKDLCNYMKELKDDEDFLYQTFKEYGITNRAKTQLKIQIGNVASGAAVIANSEVTKEITKQGRKLKGIEMEGYAVYCAASHAREPKPTPFVIKSICDYADENKNDNIQDYAAYTSARILKEFALRFL